MVEKLIMEYFYILFNEIYKILFLLVPILVSVAMIVWLDRKSLGIVQKGEDLMLSALSVYFKLLQMLLSIFLKR